MISILQCNVVVQTSHDTPTCHAKYITRHFGPKYKGSAPPHSLFSADDTEDSLLDDRYDDDDDDDDSDEPLYISAMSDGMSLRIHALVPR